MRWNLSKLNGGSCLFIYRKCRHSSVTLYMSVCVCVCVCGHTPAQNCFFYFDFTLNILSGYLEVFRQISIRINEKWDIM